MSDKMLNSIRRIAKVAHRDGKFYRSALIVGYGVGAGRGEGFDVIKVEDLDAHLDLVSGLREHNAVLRTRVAELENRLEIDQVFVGEDMAPQEAPAEKRPRMVDGITARDTTIAMLEEKVRFLEVCVENQLYKINELETDLEKERARSAGIDATSTALTVENAQLLYQIKHGIGSGGDGGAAGQPGKPGK